MTTRAYTYLIAAACVLVSIAAAAFSVTGLVKLFAGAGVSVAIMAGSLEFSKFVIVGFVYRYWGHIHRPLRAYLIFSIAVLMVITSVGIYGYLSEAYQTASLEMHELQIKTESLNEENQRVLAHAQELQQFVEKIPSTRISRKFEFQKEYEPKIRKLLGQSESILNEMGQEKLKMLSLEQKTGPVAYLAKSLHAETDVVVKYLILIFVSVFDPLAVSLVFSWNLLIRLREKYRGDDYKIGARSLINPVNHRFKKSA